MSLYEILNADVFAGMRMLKNASIQTCITSPPYYGLRNYGTARWEGGSKGCDHIEKNIRIRGNLAACAEKSDGKARTQDNRKDDGGMGVAYRNICGKCGARRLDRQIGIEETPEAYVARLVDVFREVRRVLKDDGTLWLNLGDSYNSQPGQRKPEDKIGTKQLSNRGSNDTGSRDCPGLKPKDLIGIPWRIAFALQADGWYLRSDIVWHKRNPMPESVRDRPTKAHEYLFLLAKSERYFYDAAAIKEPASLDTHARYARGRSHSHKWAAGGPGNQTIAKSFAHMRQPGVNPKCTEPGSGIKQNSSFSAAVRDIVETRNKRTVWTIATQSYKGAHFATFPEKLVEPCILAGSQPGDFVLDPFAGSGTAGAMALRHNRKFIGIELNPAYCRLAHERIAGTSGLRSAA